MRLHAAHRRRRRAHARRIAAARPAVPVNDVLAELFSAQFRAHPLFDKLKSMFVDSPNINRPEKIR